MIIVSKLYCVTGMEHHPSRHTGPLRSREEQGIPISILPDKLPCSCHICRSLFQKIYKITKTQRKQLPNQIHGKNVFVVSTVGWLIPSGSGEQTPVIWFEVFMVRGLLTTEDVPSHKHPILHDLN